MIHIRIAPILLAALICLSLAPKVSAQGTYISIQPPQFRVVRAYWGTSDSEILAAPGDMKIPLTVVMQNIGNSTVTGLSGTLVLQQPFANISGGMLSRAFYDGSVSPGSTFTLKFILNIDADATPGEYLLNMTVDYLMIVSGVGKTLYIVMKTGVEVPVLVTRVRYLVIYSVNVFPSEVAPAGNFTISGSIVNTASSSFYNTNVSISSPALVREPFIFIGQIDPNIPRPFSFPLQVRRGLQGSEFQIRILATYRDSLGVTHLSSATATIRVQQREIPTRPVTAPQARGLSEIMAEILWRIIRFFFGLSALVALGHT